MASSHKARKMHLLMDVTVHVPEGISDEELYEAICNQFAGTGEGLQMRPNEGKVVADSHNIEIYGKHNPDRPYESRHVWGSTM